MDFIILVIVCIGIGAWGFERVLFEIKRKRTYQQDVHEDSESWNQEP